MSLLNNLSIKDRAEVYQLYKKHFPELKWRSPEMVEHFGNGGELKKAPEAAPKDNTRANVKVDHLKGPYDPYWQHNRKNAEATQPSGVVRTQKDRTIAQSMDHWYNGLTPGQQNLADISPFGILNAAKEAGRSYVKAAENPSEFGEHMTNAVLNTVGAIPSLASTKLAAKAAVNATASTAYRTAKKMAPEANYIKKMDEWMVMKNNSNVGEVLLDEMPHRQISQTLAGQRAFKKQYADPEFKKRLDQMYNGYEDDIINNAKNPYIELEPLVENQGEYHGFIPGDRASAGPTSGRAFVNAKFMGAADRKSTTIHELTHQLTNGNEYLGARERGLLRDPFITGPEWMRHATKHAANDAEIGEYINHYRYYTKPTEVHARINEIRHAINPGNPLKEIEISDLYKIDEMRMKNQLPSNVNSMINLLDPERGYINLMETMNKMYTPAIGATLGLSALSAYEKRKKNTQTP
jgi:hypothetical protein